MESNSANSHVPGREHYTYVCSTQCRLSRVSTGHRLVSLMSSEIECAMLIFLYFKVSGVLRSWSVSHLFQNSGDNQEAQDIENIIDPMKKLQLPRYILISDILIKFSLFEYGKQREA